MRLYIKGIVDKCRECAPAALGIVEESPQRGLELRVGQARTWNGKPGRRQRPYLEIGE